MIDYANSSCPNCRCSEKTIAMDDDCKYYVSCNSCDFETEHFKFIAQAQVNWVLGGHNGTPM
jgi:hypothetical protein